MSAFQQVMASLCGGAGAFRSVEMPVPPGRPGDVDIGADDAAPDQKVDQHFGRRGHGEFHQFLLGLIGENYLAACSSEVSA